VRDQAQYYRLDTADRSRSLREWNKPIYWPLITLIVLIGGLAWWAVRVFKAREMETALAADPGASLTRGG